VEEEADDLHGLLDVRLGAGDHGPNHAPDHNGVVFDAVSFALAMDALTHPGPAKPSRVGKGVCAQDTMPGVARALANAKLGAYTGKLVQLLGPTGPKAQAEPPLASYAR
jgi:hypothetical protein